MEDAISKAKHKIENFIENNAEHKNKKIGFILINPDTKETISIAFGNDDAIQFSPYNKGVGVIQEWAFSFDEYLFHDLENNYQIGNIDDSFHYSIWCWLDEMYPQDIIYKDGVQNYLQYCADNGITKDYIDKKNNLDVPDVMKHFEGLALFETMEYKGYVIETTDVNNDNKEKLINIYENRNKYKKKEPIDTISLNTVGLKKNIKDHVDKLYIEKNKKIIKGIEYFVHPKGTIFAGMKIRIHPEDAFENAIARGMKNPEDWMYMYSKNNRDYFKNYDFRNYISYPQFGPLEMLKQKFNKSKERER